MNLKHLIITLIIPLIKFIDLFLYYIYLLLNLTFFNFLRILKYIDKFYIKKSNTNKYNTYILYET